MLMPSTNTRETSPHEIDLPCPEIRPIWITPGQVAVIGLLALAKRQAQIQSDLSQPLHHLHDVQIAARKEFTQR